MVRCGYVRDGHYNSRYHPWSDSRGSRTSVVIIWQKGRIRIPWRRERRYVGKTKGGKAKYEYIGEPRLPKTVTDFTTEELIMVAHHLPAFVDALEKNCRHVLRALEDACATLQEFIERIEADPRPAQDAIPG